VERHQVLPIENKLGVLYLREGIVVDDFSVCWDDLIASGMVNAKGGRNGPFSILASGTAHAVLNHSARRWNPIAMTALKPDLTITFGASEQHDSTTTFPTLESEGYRIAVRHTTDFPADAPERLGVPRTDVD
jgi:hypothetical protein